MTGSRRERSWRGLWEEGARKTGNERIEQGVKRDVTRDVDDADGRRGARGVKPRRMIAQNGQGQKKPEKSTT